jgi:hypothetical protein
MRDATAAPADPLLFAGAVLKPFGAEMCGFVLDLYLM